MHVVALRSNLKMILNHGKPFLNQQQYNKSSILTFNSKRILRILRYSHFIQVLRWAKGIWHLTNLVGLLAVAQVGQPWPIAVFSKPGNLRTRDQRDLTQSLGSAETQKQLKMQEFFYIEATSVLFSQRILISIDEEKATNKKKHSTIVTVPRYAG